METSSDVNKIAFNKLINLFRQRSEHLFILPSTLGKGYVQVFNLEKGLQVRFWNLCFTNQTEAYNDVLCTDEKDYCTLAFFLNTQGLSFTNGESFLQNNIIWDTIFISNLSIYKINLSPMARASCLSISFSKRWLNETVFNNEVLFKNLKEALDAADSFSLHESMNQTDKEDIKELMNITWKKTLGSFYIKSYVLKLVCNFFYSIKDRDLTGNKPSVKASVMEVEKYLSQTVTNELPNLKYLASSFSISESTLTRHFKKQYGVSISAYFIRKKMEYANQLMKEKNMSMNEVASLLNYKNLDNFKCMFRKYNVSYSVTNP